jgi:uncharacterized protein
MQDLPLYTLFDTVRDRLNRHLGLSDYMLLLEAMQQGMGIADNNELRDLCAMLWLKNKPQQDQFKAFFEKFSQNQVESYLKALEKKNESTGVLPKSNEEDKPQEPINQPNTPSDFDQKNETTTINQEDKPSESAEGMVTVQWRMDKINSNAGDALNTEGVADERWKPTGKYIMTDNYQPFNERQLTQQWRRLRRRQVIGLSRDMDISATIKHAAKQGFFDKTIMKRRFVNDYRLIVLVDWKGSMLAFHTLSDLIVDTLKQELPKTEVYYFRNQPQQYFYGNSNWTQAIETKDLLFQLAQNPANILIISDGGAARGSYVTERLQAWWNFLKQVKPIVPNIVWLNPMPQERWAGSTAGYVEKMVKMREVGEELDSLKNMLNTIKECNK